MNGEGDGGNAQGDESINSQILKILRENQSDLKDIKKRLSPDRVTRFNINLGTEPKEAHPGTQWLVETITQNKEEYCDLISSSSSK